MDSFKQFSAESSTLRWSFPALCVLLEERYPLCFIAVLLANKYICVFLRT